MQTMQTMQVARYTPVLSDNNRSLSCTVRQQRGRTVQFSRTFVLRYLFLEVTIWWIDCVFQFRLEVVEAAKGQPLVKKVSLLSLLLLSILLLLLSSALCIILVLRRRKRERSRRESSLSKSNALPPIYRLDTPLLLQRESLGRDCELGETPRWASQRYPSTPTTSHCKMFTSPGTLLQPLLTSPSSLTSNGSSINSFIDLTGQADAFAEPCLPTAEEEESMMTASPRLGGGSVPHLASRRRSSLARPAPPPRPPRSARSLGHLHNAKEEPLEGDKGRGREGRRRRKTAPARLLQKLKT